MSGRALRRLPVLALARYIGVGNIMSTGMSNGQSDDSARADVDAWLDGMDRVVDEQAKQHEKLV